MGISMSQAVISDTMSSYLSGYGVGVNIIVEGQLVYVRVWLPFNIVANAVSLYVDTVWANSPAGTRVQVGTYSSSGQLMWSAEGLVNAGGVVHAWVAPVSHILTIRRDNINMPNGVYYLALLSVDGAINVSKLESALDGVQPLAGGKFLVGDQLGAMGRSLPDTIDLTLNDMGWRECPVLRFHHVP